MRALFLLSQVPLTRMRHASDHGLKRVISNQSLKLAVPTSTPLVRVHSEERRQFGPPRLLIVKKSTGCRHVTRASSSNLTRSREFLTRSGVLHEQCHLFGRPRRNRSRHPLVPGHPLMIPAEGVAAPVKVSRVEWGAIFGGGVVTTAIGLTLLTFGATLGLVVASPYDGEGLSPAAFAIAAGLYLLWVQLSSFYIGGYITARMRSPDLNTSEHETDVRDGLHGVIMWGVSVVAAAIIAFAGIGIAKVAADAPPNELTASVAQVAEEKVNEQAAAERANDEDGAVATVAERRAEIARKATIISAFITAASLFLGLVAAFYGAQVGGNHRDKNVEWIFFNSRARIVPKVTGV